MLAKTLPLSPFILVLVGLLAACAGSGEKILSSQPPSDAAAASGPAPASPPLADPGNGPFTAGQISAIISGRSWRYELGRIRGIVTYHAGGAMNYEEEGKGAGAGKWWTGDFTLCETRYPTPFLPEGRAEDCAGFRKAGNQYYLGRAKLTLL
jgi:hypothetical protein